MSIFNQRCRVDPCVDFGAKFPWVCWRMEGSCHGAAGSVCSFRIWSSDEASRGPAQTPYRRRPGSPDRRELWERIITHFLKGTTGVTWHINVWNQVCRRTAPYRSRRVCLMTDVCNFFFIVETQLLKQKTMRNVTFLFCAPDGRSELSGAAYRNLSPSIKNQRC